jgi:hypothetical protein
MSEFGLRDWQMRVDLVVKNSHVFQVLQTTNSKDVVVREVLNHGDVDSNDLNRLAETGETFFVFCEPIFQHKCWQNWFFENRSWFSSMSEQFPDGNCWVVDGSTFQEFARVVVANGEVEVQTPRHFV